MSNCTYNIGDRVDTPAGCGEVVDKNPVGNHCILRVDLDSGGTISIDCRQASPCRRN